MGYDQVIPQFINRILKREDPFKIYGNQLRTFCFVDDFVRGLKLIGESADIGGEIINLTSRTLSYASIECVLLDGQGRQIGTTLDNTTNLGARRIWKFSALVIENGVASYRCEAPTGF